MRLHGDLSQRAWVEGPSRLGARGCSLALVLQPLPAKISRCSSVVLSLFSILFPVYWALQLVSLGEITAIQGWNVQGIRRMNLSLLSPPFPLAGSPFRGERQPLYHSQSTTGHRSSDLWQLSCAYPTRSDRLACSLYALHWVLDVQFTTASSGGIWGCLSFRHISKDPQHEIIINQIRGNNRVLLYHVMRKVKAFEKLYTLYKANMFLTHGTIILI